MGKPVDGIPDIYLAGFTYDAADDLPLPVEALA
jgi:hypothetical protein